MNRGEKKKNRGYEGAGIPNSRGVGVGTYATYGGGDHHHHHWQENDQAAGGDSWV